MSTSTRAHYFVSIFHTKDSSLQYENYAYTFSAEPPYHITAISRRPIALRGKRVRFVSSLTYLGHHKGIDEAMVGISYGSDDVQGRLAVLPLRVLLRDLEDVASLSANASSASGATSGLRLQTAYEVAQQQQQQVPGGHGGQPGSAGADGSGSDGGGEVQQISVGRNHEGHGHCFTMPGVRFDAPSIKMMLAPAPEQCCTLCSTVEYCAAFSWSPADGGTCWLKQWTGTAVARHGFVSGHFGRRATCACEVRRDVAIELVATGGGDRGGGGGNTSLLNRLPSKTHSSCCDRCLQQDGCGGWSWSPPIHVGGDSSGGGSCALYRVSSAAEAHSASFYTPAAGHVSGVAALKRSVLLVHHHPPQQRLGSDRRLLALVGQLRRLDWRVAYAGADDYDPGPVKGRRLLTQLGVPLLSAVKDADALASFAKQHDVSVVVLCLWFWGSATVPTRYLHSLRTKLPHLKLVVMSDDVHGQRAALEAEDEGRSAASKEVTRIRDEEQKTYFHADHILCISESDRTSILRSLPSAKPMHELRFSTLRHVYADEVLFPLERRVPYEERQGLVFVGNLNNPTNLQSMRWFMREVWPRLRQVEPGMTLRVVGSLNGQSAVASGLPELLRTTSGVQAAGYVSDEELGPMLQRSRLFIAPIRWATGIVTKQTLAHVHGLPTVVTPTAAMHVAPAPLDPLTGKGDAWSHQLGRYEMLKVAAIGDSAAEYAAAILHMHRNETAWQELSLNGARYARSGGGGKGVCPSGLADDWLAFWAKMTTGACSGTF